MTRTFLVLCLVALGALAIGVAKADGPATPTPRPFAQVTPVPKTRVVIPMLAREVWYHGINKVVVDEPISAGEWLADPENNCIIGIYLWDPEAQVWLHRFPVWRREFPDSWDEIQVLLPGKLYFMYCRSGSEEKEPVDWLAQR